MQSGPFPFGAYWSVCGEDRLGGLQPGHSCWPSSLPFDGKEVAFPNYFIRVYATPHYIKKSQILAG